MKKCNFHSGEWCCCIGQEFHKTVDSNFEKIRSNVLWGGGICDSILDSVDKLNNFILNKRIGTKILGDMGFSELGNENQDYVKRGFDLLICIPMLPLVLLIMALVAICIKLESPGKVFFNDYRIGKSGRTFLCYKFRSMYIDSDRILQEYLEQNDIARKEWNEFQKLRGYDPRVTAVGRFIRKTSLDELPQVINVLLGDMSLVGPRPYLPREKNMIGDYLDIICQVQPGITGIWQVSGRSDVNFAGRLEFDEWYVNNHSIWVDIKCLLKTARIVLFSKGAY